MIIKRFYLIILAIPISAYGGDIKNNNTIKFEEAPDEQFDLDDGYYDDSIIGVQDLTVINNQKVKFKDDYNDLQNEHQDSNENEKQIVFKDDPKNIETVKNPVKFETDESDQEISDVTEVSGRVAFVDDSKEQNVGQKKKRKRRRRPKYQSYPGQGNPNSVYPLGNPVNPNQDIASGLAGYPNYPYPQYPGYPSGVSQPGLQYPGYPGQLGLESNPNYVPGQGYQGYGLLQPGLQQPGLQGYYRPPRRPKSLWTTKAISALSEALTSIATNDDYQCVPRLLCEAAGGRASGSSFLQSVSGLEPLLSLLSTYNGLTTSPLYVFGRAVILGMTSKGNTASCRYAYPQCPTDPEKLIFYLNNHNGGFFRFFNSPITQNQNIEQFYNQLAEQYQLNGNQQFGQNIQYNQISGQEHQYGLLNQNIHNNNQNYGSNYGYGQNKYGYLNQNSYRKENIEDRIQNKPVLDQDENSLNPVTYTSAEYSVDGQKWLFPDEINTNNDIRHEIKPARFGNVVKFPEDHKLYANKYKDYIRKGKTVQFPEFNTRIIRNYETTTKVSLDDYVFDYKHNFYVKRPKPEANKYRDDNVQTVYIVRGNGDPNRPEIVKVRPGQSYS